MCSLSGTQARGINHAAQKVELFLEQSVVNLLAAGLLCQLHLNLENMVSGKLFKMANFLLMGFLVVLLVLGAGG